MLRKSWIAGGYETLFEMAAVELPVQIPNRQRSILTGSL